MTTIQDYHNYLIANDVKITILDYVKELNERYYKIDISFIDDFIALVDKDECCIPHSMLKLYGITELVGGSIDVAKQIKKCKLIENTDYQVSQLADQSSTSRGTKYSNIYIFHPDAFKKLLIRSSNTNKYANYYILLERCIKYYYNYQSQMNELLIKSKTIEISDLKKTVDDQTRKIDQILGHTTDIKEELSSLTDLALDQIEQKEIAEAKIENAKADIINGPVHNYNIEQLVVFEIDNTLYNIRGTMKYVSVKCKQLCGTSLLQIIKNGYKKDLKFEYTYLRYYKDVPNAMHLFRVVKNQLKDGIDSHLNTITFPKNSTKTIPEVLDVIQNIFDQRLTIEVSDIQYVKAKKKAVSMIKK